jgi:glycosyltransferase involved in cell wall biosynthesis
MSAVTIPGSTEPVRLAQRSDLSGSLRSSDANTVSPLLPKLTIVIPALNEEESIGQTIQRCLEARDHIRGVGRIRDVEVVVVSDGSTDRTAQIAQEVAAKDAAVSVIVFPKNRGYGAALKEGFLRGTGELVSFLDADGTCDPAYFADMCQALQERGAAVVLGSRMGPQSEMPKLRRLGNRIFALVLGVLSGKAVSDTASGMRVIRRDALPELYPLPDGMHFTPAMSARALMNDLGIVEIPMQYSERVGESKLRVLKDGFRFLRAIWEAMLIFRPSRIFLLLTMFCALVGLAWGLFPIEFYVREGRLEEWMIYRVLLCTFLFTCSFVFLCAGVIGDQIMGLVHRQRWRSFLSQAFDRLLSPRALIVTAGGSAAVAIALVWPGLMEYLRTGHITLHWSRAIVAVFLLHVSLFAVVTSVLRSILNLWKGQLDYVRRHH